MKKRSALLLAVALGFSMLFSSSVFAANGETSAWDSFLGLFSGNQENQIQTDSTQVMGVTYQTHIQNEGWAQGWVSDGAMSGSEGKGLRLEGIEIKLDGTSLPAGLGIRYQTHIQNEGWAQGWVSNGEMSGSEGKGLRLEAIKIELTGTNASDYSVQYRTHIQNEGWAQGWVSDGALSGSEGKGLRLEGIEIKIVQKTANLDAYNAAVAKANAISANDYTKTTYDALQAALAANQVTANDKQSVVDAATAAINTAYNGLEKVFGAKSVTAVNASKLKVELTSAVDGVTAANFSINGMTVVSASLDATKTIATLQVSGAELGKDYALTTTGLVVNGVTKPDATKSFTMPVASSLYTAKLVADDNVLTSDGADQTLLTFTLTDSDGQIVADSEDVEIAFTTTFGSCAENRVTLQNGVATVLLISESLTQDRTALVRATVVESNQKQLINLTAEVNVLMTPNPGAIEPETVGATLVDIAIEQADRVVLYFNKDVTVERYTTNGAYDAAKAEIAITTALGSANESDAPAVIGYMAVPGNSKALYAILDTDNVLIDNSVQQVRFQDKTGTILTDSTRTKIFTDARRPALLTVERDGLKALTLTFSEPIIKGDPADSGEELLNWAIDGVTLDQPILGGLTVGSVVVGGFDPATGTDLRNVVTITLADGDYFTAGKHSIQGANIGDWADLSDAGNNVMNTQTLDFVIPEDNQVPTCSIVVQSPEQYVMTFDKEIIEDDAALAAALELERFDSATGTWIPATFNAATPWFRLTNIGNDDVTYKVEALLDWTSDTMYNTNTTHLNYYNDTYRIVLPAGSVTAAVNGKQNADQTMLLEGAMKTPDVTSPVISSITAGANPSTDAYTVVMSEPIKMPAGGDGLPTLAQGQASIPQPTAEFIKKDQSVTIPASAITAVNDAFDTTIQVTPSIPLTNGDWTLVVRSISDDVGNTAASATKEFNVNITVDPPVTEKFVLEWAVADTDYSDGFTTVTNTREDGTGQQDAIYLKFNKPLKLTGDQTNALKTTNYTLNGAQLPVGTQIVSNILNYVDGNEYIDSVTIILPDGTLTAADTTVITVSKYLEDVPNVLGEAVQTLTNGGQYKLPMTFDVTVRNALNVAKLAVAALNQADYTAASWAGITTANALPEVTQAEMAAKTTALNTAQAALVTKASVLATAAGQATPAIAGITPTNATTPADILAVVDAAVTNNDVTSSFVVPPVIVPAALGVPGSITGTVTLTFEGATTTVAVNLVIPAL